MALVAPVTLHRQGAKLSVLNHTSDAAHNPFFYNTLCVMSALFRLVHVGLETRCSKRVFA